MIIAEELSEVLNIHGDDRMSRIIPDEGDLSLEDLIADDELIVTVSSNGYLKSVVASTYRSQGRGGRGVKAAEVREDDVLNPRVAYNCPCLPALLHKYRSGASHQSP